MVSQLNLQGYVFIFKDNDLYEWIEDVDRKRSRFINLYIRKMVVRRKEHIIEDCIIAEAYMMLRGS